FDSEYVGDACQPPCCSLSKLSTSFTFSTPYTTLFRSIDIVRANQLRNYIWKIVQEERHYQGKPVDLQKIPQVLKTYETENPFGQDRKSTRLNSSHVSISYAVFCLKLEDRDDSDSSVPH